MRVLVIAHPDGGTAGVFAEEAQARGVALDAWNPGAGDAAPARPAAEYDAVVVLGGGQNVAQRDRYPYLDEEIAVLRGALDGDHVVDVYVVSLAASGTHGSGTVAPYIVGAARIDSPEQHVTLQRDSEWIPAPTAPTAQVPARLSDHSEPR